MENDLLQSTVCLLIIGLTLGNPVQKCGINESVIIKNLHFGIIVQVRNTKKNTCNSKLHSIMPHVQGLEHKNVK